MRTGLLFAGAVLALLGPTGGARAQTTPEVWREPLTGIEFVAIPRGCFVMGRNEPVEQPWLAYRTPMPKYAEAGRDEMPRHEVCLDAFWISRHEIRIADWNAVMGEPAFRGDAQAAVAGVSWQQARAFARTLGERTTARAEFALPSEAQWEYACRAGSTDDVAPADAERIDEAWYGTPGRRIEAPAPVKSLRANAYGLYDMLGNVWEWVEDTYAADAYARHVLYNPRVEGKAAERVIRGASYRSEPFNVRCGRRGFQDADAASPVIGFRLVRTPR